MSQKISPNIIRTCKICGQQFHPTARKQSCCNQIKLQTCEICGKQFEIICNTSDTRTTCSKECTAELIKLRKQAYASTEQRICKWCGKSFTPKSGRDVYCYDTHYRACEICGKQFVIDVRRNPYVRTCSKECHYRLIATNVDKEGAAARLKDTMLERYGVDNAMKLQSSKDKMIATNVSRYGAEWYSQTDEYKAAVKDSSNRKYGCDHHLSSQTVIDKRKGTCMQKYGVDNVSKIPEVRSRIEQSIKDRYGVSFNSQTHIPDMTAWKYFISNPRAYILDTFEDKPTIQDIACKLGVCITSIYEHIDLEHNSDVIARCQSMMESQVIEFIQSIDGTIVIRSHNRSIISPYEIDIFLPDYNIGIECNPTATHNSSIKDPWGNCPKPHDYHKIKSSMCAQRGIRLIHIYGYEWNHKRQIIESMLRYSLHRCNRTIYARNCSIRLVDYAQSVSFLSDNHRQGACTSSIRLGLYYNDELVSLMTFGKLRNSISKSASLEGYELLRFCSLLNTSVIGGASKLFKYYIKNYCPQLTISYSDISHTSGNIYPTLGFSKVSESAPGYVWVDTITDVAYNRINAQKHNICKFLHDDTINLSDTEDNIMTNHGYVKVYDSGAVRWEYINWF